MMIEINIPNKKFEANDNSYQEGDCLDNDNLITMVNSI